MPTKCLRPVVREIWILGNFGAFGPNAQLKIRIEPGGTRSSIPHISDLANLLPEYKWVSPNFLPDHQVNPENRPSKDSKTADILDFAIIGRSSPFLNWSTTMLS